MWRGFSLSGPPAGESVPASRFFSGLARLLFGGKSAAFPERTFFFARLLLRLTPGLPAVFLGM